MKNQHMKMKNQHLFLRIVAGMFFVPHSQTRQTPMPLPTLKPYVWGFFLLPHEYCLFQRITPSATFRQPTRIGWFFIRHSP